MIKDNANLDSDLKAEIPYKSIWEANAAQTITHLSNLGQVVSLGIHFFPVKEVYGKRDGLSIS